MPGAKSQLKHAQPQNRGEAYQQTVKILLSHFPLTEPDARRPQERDRTILLSRLTGQILSFFYPVKGRRDRAQFPTKYNFLWSRASEFLFARRKQAKVRDAKGLRQLEHSRSSVGERNGAPKL